MNRWLAAGSLLLAGQCALVIALYWPQVFDPPEVGAPQFSSFTPDAVDEIYVGDEYDNETLLLRAGQRWLLPELENLPADGDMVAKLLQALTRGDTTWPVAESVAARQRFQVANYYYQQKDYARAIDTFENVLGNHPDAKFLDVILFNYGRCLFRMGRRTEAKRRFDQLIGEFPESPLAPDAKKISDALTSQQAATPPAAP